MGVIEIEGMKFYAYHGHFAAEQIVGNNFEVYVRLETNCVAAAESDNLDDALNYQAVYETIKEVMQEKSALLENVSKRILDALYDRFPKIEKARIKISKMNPPMGGEMERVSVTLER
ncbi:dihydroneopterin aldolase [Draconibacterium sp. IB214405]|uniref:dihydroneopterin aldolase n=1 Tax=Draconibacterium sp. IB214405 TaxID=3097352 RepID=UPI002A147C36|nr:dihydroneopterin aldolase [Draconibacterium sp. IB214405]MDX8338602.1 dihydroneopterin aldolase [Draconibacterium sp. IB214405]